ncbi:SDR family NAD(P)-dependent oxidoreductase [Tuwongella immobilis]|uniref:Ketoreductase domain-containing protein n=1 Tax=Tuwongella immobilis TaxID=692036 RepID=A0A6C2YVM8_9BACT|nr:SDR family NAD(P)-dependent oxidoreductase [Tuwongella immobilis]VIP05441.1 short-chain dehydrogenase reductase sdr : Oxidoreductase, short-chain dehydrogenase/reductase family protein OS=uncultured planctomycete GN=HGMM_F13D05C11 PE=3 SV=1: adh_short [Tuwongella immobilis]VTS08238.1 short-chain dehydrogenase reductase sdr : Oxidoreductase, short-chain dehydrogenase/reductase family protein OS=uncultured planctomycete GN=HGMM_F13D05C11 PE=3 SV=1: adh_short [Tuwongella immobilis]
MRRDLRGRVVLVTGSSRNLGKRIAQMLAQRGAKLVITGRDPSLVEATAAEIRRDGAEVLGIAGDLTQDADRIRLRDAIVERFGGLDVLINNAGMASFGEFATSSEALMRTILEINFFTPVELIRLFTPLLKASADQGRIDGQGWRPAIVNISSICGRVGIPSYPEHSSSKFAIAGMTESLHGEYSRFDIDVLLIVPGTVNMPDRMRHYLRNEGRISLDLRGTPQDTVAEKIIRAIERNRRETLIGGMTKFLVLSKKLAPRILEFFMIRKVRNFEKRAKLGEGSATTAGNE